MIGSNYSSSFSFFLRTIVLLLFSISNVFSTFAFLTPDMCHPDQRDVLLQLKTEFKIQKPDELDDYSMNVTSYPKTESWGNRSTDCCNWDGVTCNTESGKVIRLELSCSCLHGQLEPNSSLFSLKHLTSLNLAFNNFTFSPIPAKFSNLMLLETLNLSGSSLKGHIPREILQLTNLVSLDLSSYVSIYSPPSSLLLSIENPPLFLRLLAQNLRNLRALDLSSVNISSEIPHEFSYMLSLRSLHLERCSLVGEFPSGLFMIPSLQSIILDNNPDLRGSLPIFHRNNCLQVLRLWETSFSGIIPDSIGNLKNLASLTLADSNFSGRIPSSLGELSNLSSLSLSSNHFTGEVPSSIGNLKQLISFDVDYNQLTGSFPSVLLNLTKLRSIYLDSNHFTGAVPSSLLQISSLTRLELDDYQLSDLVGFENVSLFSNLQVLYFTSNNFRVSSAVDLNVFSSLKQLVMLDLPGIPLSTENITSDSDFSSNFMYLRLSGCNITEFPEFLRDQRNLRHLYLSNNNIKGQVPDWLWRQQALQSLDLSHNSLSGFDGSLKAVPGSHIEMLDLRSNAFQGRILIPYTSINYLFASSNNFTGEIPRSLCGGQSSPTLIDLSNNNFDGTIPQCLGAHMSSLTDLNLRNNSLSGSLPDMFTQASKLRSIDVSHNQLEGKIPASLTACSSLEVLNVESNKINDTFPFLLNSLQKLQVLVLRSNKFHGMLHHSDGVWFGFPQLKIIDVSHNEFLGTLPSDYFLNWTAISSNEDKDRQPHYIGDSNGYGYYTSVVLMNKGVSMAMEQSESPVSSKEKEEKEESFCWVAAGLGFAPGVVFGFTIGYIVVSYKHEWFIKTFGRNKKRGTR
ncbi:hypothetical protein Bca52824_060417 [Brassica carinata]|uniref:Leucine-rich repeat-containing N-terminal plant-type domain-containing protein n=1 Tax=Brassica carinata TaxID=52824 RepID=A0A8X7UGH6_BRACI|nr:hypothetical protein Bca52824_060417 [Brassica carinata]